MSDLKKYQTGEESLGPEPAGKAKIPYKAPDVTVVKKYHPPVTANFSPPPANRRRPEAAREL